MSEATLDCRLLPGVNCDEFVSGMKARFNNSRASPLATSLFDAVRAAIAKHHPDAHGDAERLPVAEFLKGIHIYFDLLRSEY